MMISKLKPYLFILPALVWLFIWFYEPLLANIRYIFYDWNLVPGTVARFVGLKNFVRLFSNADFYKAIKNTLFYMVAMLPFSILIPLFVAITTQRLKGKVKKITRFLVFIPMILAPVAVSILFQWLLHPTNGLVNTVLLRIGIIQHPISFFFDPFWSRVAVAFISGWKMIGFSTIMFIAAVESINPEYEDVARLEGVTTLRRHFDITIPLLSPTIMLMLMMSILFSSRWSFTFIDVLTQGGPFGSSTNVYYLMYDFAFADMSVGMSAAASLLFLVVFGIIALVMQELSRRIAFYDN